MPEHDQFLTVKQAAKVLQVAPNTVRSWGALGKLPEYRHPVNNYRLFKATDVEVLRSKIEQPILRGAEKVANKRPRAK